MANKELLEKKLELWLLKEHPETTKEQREVLTNELVNRKAVNIEWLVDNKRPLQVILDVIANEKAEEEKIKEYAEIHPEFKKKLEHDKLQEKRKENRTQTGIDTDLKSFKLGLR